MTNKSFHTSAFFKILSFKIFKILKLDVVSSHPHKIYVNFMSKSQVTNTFWKHPIKSHSHIHKYHLILNNPKIRKKTHTHTI